MADPTPLPAIDDAVSQVEDYLAGGGASVVVQGDPTAGKSTVLSRFAARARATGKQRVVELRVPRATSYGSSFGITDDAGPVLLGLAAAQLRDVDSAAFEALGKVSWGELRAALGDTLKKNDVLLVIDDVVPTDVDPTFGSFFGQRTREALDTLLGSSAQRVLTTTAHSINLGTKVVQLETASHASSVLDPKRWNGLGDAARSLSQGASSERLAVLSPLELRLAVALVARGADPRQVVERPKQRLASDLFEALDAPSLRAVLARLALVRGPVDSALLRELGAASLDGHTRLLLEHAILFEEEGCYSLHEVFAREASVADWLNADGVRDAHETIGAHHFARFTDATALADPASALRHELESFYHYTQAGDAAVVDRVRVLFTEQLDGLGKTLSLRGQHPEAVSVYERAVAREPNDWYAHHYLAFNLDVQGRSAAVVESEYERARELNAKHVWHHSRLACFYVTRARMTDARNAWDRALGTLRTQHIDDGKLFKELHRPFAHVLLHRGELELAAEVLNDVPRRLRFEWHTTLVEALEMLTAQERDELVFPPSAPGEPWAAGPNLLRRRGQDTKWMPGRVAHVGDAEVSIRVATEPGVLGWYDRPFEEVETAWRGSAPIACGTFVQIVIFGDGREEILAHEDRGQVLPRLKPPSDRYIKARLAQTDGSTDAE